MQDKVVPLKGQQLSRDPFPCPPDIACHQLYFFLSSHHHPMVQTSQYDIYFVCVCVHACMHACIRVCMHACVRACVHACVHVLVCVYVRACMCVWF